MDKKKDNRPIIGYCIWCEELKVKGDGFIFHITRESHSPKYHPKGICFECVKSVNRVMETCLNEK